MRRGKNPIRDHEIQGTGINHRIIIPYYITSDPYYIESLDILKLCIDSLKAHSVYPIIISLVANGELNLEICKSLYELQNDKRIDELHILPYKTGKINAILSVLRNTREFYVTITDADVYFKPRWDEAIMSVFNNINKATAVSPTPIFRTETRLTNNIWFDYLFSDKLKFSDVENPRNLELWAKSIGWSYLPNRFKQYLLTLEENGVKTVVGNSHFCVTYRNDVFKYLPYESAIHMLGGNSEFEYLDLPVVKCDGYRLATFHTFAYHIGNSLIDIDFDTSLKNVQQKSCLQVNKTFRIKLKPVAFFIKFKLFEKLIAQRKFKIFLFKSKKLPITNIRDF